MDDGHLRLAEPMVREGGRLRPASWEEALTRAASGFASAREQGPQAFGMFSCSKTTNELNYMAQKFTRASCTRTTSTTANRLYTPPASPGLRPGSEPEAGPSPYPGPGAATRSS